jgi:hypothetical protein
VLFFYVMNAFDWSLIRSGVEMVTLYSVHLFAFGVIMIYVPVLPTPSAVCTPSMLYGVCCRTTVHARSNECATRTHNINKSSEYGLLFSF